MLSFSVAAETNDQSYIQTQKNQKQLFLVTIPSYCSSCYTAYVFVCNTNLCYILLYVPTYHAAIESHCGSRVNQMDHLIQWYTNTIHSGYVHIVFIVFSSARIQLVGLNKVKTIYTDCQYVIDITPRCHSSQMHSCSWKSYIMC